MLTSVNYETKKIKLADLKFLRKVFNGANVKVMVNVGEPDINLLPPSNSNPLIGFNSDESYKASLGLCNDPNSFVDGAAPRIANYASYNLTRNYGANAYFYNLESSYIDSYNIPWSNDNPMDFSDRTNDYITDYNLWRFEYTFNETNNPYGFEVSYSDGWFNEVENPNTGAIANVAIPMYVEMECLQHGKLNNYRSRLETHLPPFISNINSNYTLSSVVLDWTFALCTDCHCYSWYGTVFYGELLNRTINPYDLVQATVPCNCDLKQNFKGETLTWSLLHLN